jgi:hypothetical protein
MHQNKCLANKCDFLKQESREHQETIADLKRTNDELSQLVAGIISVLSQVSCLN